MNRYIKIGSYVITALVGGTVGATLFPKIETKTEIKEVVKWKTKVETKLVDKIVYKDRVKVKTVTRTITKKDGTVIVEKEDTKDETRKTARVEKDSRKAEQEVSKETVFVKTETKSSFNLGLDVFVFDGNFETGNYEFVLEPAFRLSSLPVFVGPSIKFDKDFKFDGLGVTFRWEF